MLPILLIACGGEDRAATEGARLGQGPFAGVPRGVEVDDGTPSVRREGLHSRVELDEGDRTAANPEAAAAFSRGFRLAFAADPALRDGAGAAAELRRSLTLDPANPHAHRALGMALFRLGGDPADGLPHLERAIELRPDWGAAQYDLAFLLCMTDRKRGRLAFRRAIELGAGDPRRLGRRFYER